MGDVRVLCVKYFSLDSLMQDCSLFTPGGDKGKPRSSRLLPRSRALKSPTTAKLLEDHISHSRVFFLLLFTFSVFLCVFCFFCHSLISFLCFLFCHSLISFLCFLFCHSLISVFCGLFLLCLRSYLVFQWVLYCPIFVQRYCKQKRFPVPLL